METIRKAIRKDLETKSICKLALEIGINSTSLYRLMDGRGINGENAIRLLKHYNIRLEDIK